MAELVSESNYDINEEEEEEMQLLVEKKKKPPPATKKRESDYDFERKNSKFSA